ncbi:MAG: hypothetical protein IJZ48_00420 [Oscillospiraceae bacterium]|nr:hypothetical protein [Oscillospiraceae bacterium]
MWDIENTPFKCLTAYLSAVFLSFFIDFLFRLIYYTTAKFKKQTILYGIFKICNNFLQNAQVFPNPFVLPAWFDKEKWDLGTSEKWKIESDGVGDANEKIRADDIQCH